MEVDRAKLALRWRSTFRGAWSARLSGLLWRAKVSPLSVREVDLREYESFLSVLDGTRLLPDLLRVEPSDCPRPGTRRGDFGRASALSETVGRRPPRRFDDLGWNLSSLETVRRGFRAGESLRDKVASLQEADRLAFSLFDRSRDIAASLHDAERLDLRFGVDGDFLTSLDDGERLVLPLGVFGDATVSRGGGGGGEGSRSSEARRFSISLEEGRPLLLR